ncbi:MAG: septation protein A [Proteobacteria bacterium]|nr:septation protein A [Pseudomonadota bacterium]
MSFLLDFLPLLVFFAVFKLAQGNPDAAGAFATEHVGALVSGGVVTPDVAPVLLATLAVMAATLVQVAVTRLRGQRVPPMLWVSLALVVLLGALTVWFHSETFIKWKPTGVYAALAVVLWASHRFARRNLIQAALGSQIVLPEAVWSTLNRAWVSFFALLALLNIAVAYSVSTETWVNVKVFGFTALILVFTLAQGVYISRHAKEGEA